MNIRIHIPFSLLVIVPLLSCHDAADNVTESSPPDPSSVPFTILNGDRSDIIVKPAFSWDIGVYGNFIFEENFFYRQDLGFNFQSDWYRGHYEGMFIYNSGINNQQMCPSFSVCGETDGFLGSPEWYKDVAATDEENLVWEFINAEKDGGFRVVMNVKPLQLNLLNPPSLLSTVDDNTLYFEKPSEADSVLFEILTIPKENLTRKDILGTIFTQHRFPTKANGGEITISAENIRRVDLSSADTVFINLVSIKRVIKVVEGKNIGVTYRVNNLHPVIIH
jgi:hypothetical protein